MAVKKKTAAKKAAPKKVAKKSPAKKSAVKKSPAKKTAAKKKSTAKKTVAKKRVVKKAVAKKTPAKKTAAKKTAAKKTTAKKTAKKSTAKKSTVTKASIPSVPATGSARVNVSTTPAPAAKPVVAKAAPAKPSAAPRQGSSKALLAVLVGVVVLGAIVISNGKNKDDAPAATTSASPTAMASDSATPTPDASTTAAAAATGEAPSRFIGNWKDNSKTTMVITWNAPAGEVKGYKVETRANMGEWKVVSELSATTLSAEFAKKSEDGSTSFRVTAVYADGSVGVAKAFGFAGQFE